VTLSLKSTLVRFATVGAANTAIDVALFWVLHAVLGIFAANFLSTSAGMTFSFLVNGRHTFGASRVTPRQLVLFLATNATTMWLLQPALMYAAHEIAVAPLMLAKLVALGGSVVANFVLYRYAVWPSERIVNGSEDHPVSPSPVGLEPPLIRS
jgi:putative flippase GtrA